MDALKQQKLKLQKYCNVCGYNTRLSHHS